MDVVSLAEIVFYWSGLGGYMTWRVERIKPFRFRL